MSTSGGSKFGPGFADPHVGGKDVLRFEFVLDGEAPARAVLHICVLANELISA